MGLDSFNNTTRLGYDIKYQKPKKTFQESLSNEAIKEKLKGYKKVSDITKVIIGNHIRYFTKDGFRLGGFLNKFGENYKYLILTNGKLSWSVQIISSNEFWCKMNSKDMQEQIQTEVEDVIENKYKQKYDDMKNQSEYVLKMLKVQQKENDKLKKKLDAIEYVAKKDKKKK